MALGKDRSEPGPLILLPEHLHERNHESDINNYFDDFAIGFGDVLGGVYAATLSR